MASGAVPGGERLRAGGVRLTRQRAAVLAVIEGSPGHLGVRDVLAAIRKRRRRIGLTTVYRTLELLASLKVIRRIHLRDGCQRYARARAGHGHHVICSRCSRVVEFGDCRLGALIQSVADRTQFTIEDHWLELFGRCKACRTGRGRRQSAFRETGTRPGPAAP